MADAVPVLLPVRLETRLDPVDAGTRLRVLIVPDVCWYDRTAPATDAELDLLDAAVAAAAGPILGTPGTPAAAVATAAFDSLAAGVGASRALWLAGTFPAALDDGGAWRVDHDAGPHQPQGPTTQTRISGLPAKIELHAVIGQTAVKLGEAAPVPDLVVTPEEGTWWPTWAAMNAAGLTFDVELAPGRAEEIASLYVVGLGETDVDGIIERHIATGDLGLVRPGAPTNTVAGAAAADLGPDPAAWRALAERDADGAERRLADALLADPDQPSALVGDRPIYPLREPVVFALWAALAGHGLREVWGVSPTTVTDLQRWAVENLHPDGPLSPVRIGRQPYGVWPVSGWHRWDPADAPGGFAGAEGEALRRAVAAAEEMAARAETGLGTVDGADEDRLWDLIAQTPLSQEYEPRLCQPVSMLREALDPADRARFDDEWWNSIRDIARDIAHQPPDDGMVALGGPMPLPRLGLVLPRLAFGPAGQPLFLTGPDADPGECEAMVGYEPARWVAEACRWLVEELFRDNGLGNQDVLLRPEWMPASLTWRLLLAAGSIALDHALREDAGTSEATGPLLDTAPPLRERIASSWLTGGGGPANMAYELFRKGVYGLRDLAEQVPAEQGQAFVSELERVVLGLLDTATHRADPWLTGAASRRLATLRGTPRPVGMYGWVDGPLGGVPGPDTAVGLMLAPSDGQARAGVVLRDKSIDDPSGRWHLDITSEAIRAAVRLGDEVRAGAHPAEAIGREVERLVGDRITIDTLRQRFPVRVEHAGRRTCDGLQVLDAVLKAPSGSAPVDPGLLAAGLGSAVVERIRGLAATIDVHADLLLAEAAHHTLAGRAEAAAAALDAAAGLGTPPQLDLLATPSRGRSVRTTVLTALPQADPPPGADDASPVAVASPALAVWLAARSGDPTGPAWTWTVHTADGDVVVTLADLGLTAADAVSMDGASLRFLVATRSSVDPSAVEPAAGPESVRDLVTAVGTRPIQAVDLGLLEDQIAGFDEPIRLELENRIQSLAERATALADRLEAPVDDADLRAALVDSVRWGLPVPGADGDAAAAAATLRARVAAAPPAGGSADIANLADAIVALAAPRALLPILATSSTPLPGIGPLVDEPVGAGGRPAVDETWLELAAVVRPPLARLEAHQAMSVWAGTGPFATATNVPGDPWASTAAALPPNDPTTPHVVIAYSAGPLPAAGVVAWSVLDRYAEVIPAEQHTATGAFRFNAPAAQAPQAILLAVPAVPGERVDTEAILATVREARLVAHARMARSEDLGRLDVLLPVLPGVEDGGFHYRTPANRTG